MRAMLASSFLVTALVVVPGTPARADERPGTAITEIRQENSARATRLVVDCSGPVNYTYYSPDPLTLVVDIPEADASKIPSRINVATREVESLRVTSMARADGRNLARLEVRLASLVPYQIFSKGQSLNLVFDRADGNVKSEPTPAAPEVAPAAAEVSPPAPAVPAPTVEGPPVQAPAPAPAVAAGAKATRILSVAHNEDGGQLAVTVRADGSLRYQDFFLGNPDRLVIDFPDVVSRAPVRAIEVNSGPVRKARLAQFSASAPKVARLVLDLSERAPYRILEGADGVKVVFGEGAAPGPAPFAALRADPEPEAQGSMPVHPSAPVGDVVPSVFAAPAALPPALPTTEPDPQSAAADALAATGLPEKKYVGHPISLDFRDGDLQDIFRLFADISGMNVVVNPGVSGKITLKLNEVPWDQALDLILKANALGYSLDGNVIRIAKLGDLQKEEQERRKLADEKALAGELGSVTARISYAKAAELQDVLKRAGALSARGVINVDSRTNTILIKDLPQFLDKARGLIGELDRATPQVEIQARIVLTTRNFTRQLGVQWGFLNQQTPEFANTTGRAFPHSIIVNGASQTGGGVPPRTGEGFPVRGYAVNLPASSANSALGLTFGNIIGSFSLDAALTALEGQGRGRILSTPKVTTQNNQEAEIKSGVEFPYLTTAIQGTGITQTIFQTVAFKEALLQFKVTPQITDAGTVILTLEVKNDAPDFSRVIGTGAAAVPPINKQYARTNVLVNDGSTVVIGGMFQSTEQNSRQNTPFLSNVPILGLLFRNSGVRSENSELLLFITPRIVKG